MGTAINRRRFVRHSSDIDYSKMYLTIVSLEDNNSISLISAKVSTPGNTTSTTYSSPISSTQKTIYVSTDNGETWVAKTSSFNNQLGTELAVLNNGDKLLLKGNNSGYGGGNSLTSSDLKTNRNILSSTGNFDLQGNIMSLINGDNFIDGETDMQERAFQQLFFNCTHLIHAHNLILPSMVLTRSIYSRTFEHCINLITGPRQLPSTSINVPYVYDNMFRNCDSLIEAMDILPSTNLYESCYSSMFYNCTSLTKAPELPSTTLAIACYQNMFSGCTSLTKAPELPSTILVKTCYEYMFDRCASLNYIKCMATNISASNCTTSWVSAVSKNGIFVKNANMASWTRSTSGIPTGWTIEDYTE